MNINTNQLRPTEQEVTRLQDRIAELEQQMQALHHMLEPAFGLIATQVRTLQQYLARGDPASPNIALNELAAIVQQTHDTYREHMMDALSAIPTATFEFSTTNNTIFHSLQHYARHLDDLSQTPIQFDVPPNLHNQRFPPMIEMHLLWSIPEILRTLHTQTQAAAHRIMFDIVNRQLQVTILVQRYLQFAAQETSVGEKCIGLLPGASPSRHQLANTFDAIRARIRSIGGILSIESMPDNSTTICMRIPLRRQNDLRPHTVRALLVSSDEAFAQSLRDRLDIYGFDVMRIVKDGPKLIETAQAQHPDIILIDISLPHCDELRAIASLKASLPHSQVVLLTDTIDEQTLYEALKSGAAGYLPRNLNMQEFADWLVDLQAGELALSPDIARKVLKEFTRQVRHHNGHTTLSGAGSHDLSPRQIEVLTLVSQGHTYKTVGDQIGFSERTIKHYMSGIIKQLQLKNRAEAIAYARRFLDIGLDTRTDEQ
jgi:two-component system NarL family response regulator